MSQEESLKRMIQKTRTAQNPKEYAAAFMEHINRFKDSYPKAMDPPREITPLAAFTKTKLEGPLFS